jgi:hypothetical protein
MISAYVHIKAEQRPRFDLISSGVAIIDVADCHLCFEDLDHARAFAAEILVKISEIDHLTIPGVLPVERVEPLNYLDSSNEAKGIL